MDQNTPYFNRLNEVTDETPEVLWGALTPDSDGPAPESPSPIVLQENTQSMTRAYSRVGLSLLVYTVVPVIAYLVLGLTLQLLRPDWLAIGWVDLLLSEIAMYGVGVPLCLLVAGAVQCDPNDIERPKNTWVALFISFFIFQFFATAGNLLGTGIMDLLSHLTGNNYGNLLESTLNDLPLWFIFLAVVIVGPIMEELIYRKMTLDRLIPFGEKRAVFFTALIFGLAHGNLHQFFYTFGGGLILGWLYVYTRRLRYPVLLHVVFNFLGGFLPMLLESWGNIDPTLSEEAYMEAFAANPLPYLLLSLYSLTVLGLALAGLVLLIIFVRRATFRPAEQPIAPRKGYRAYLNVGVCLVLVALVLLFALSFISVPAA